MLVETFDSKRLSDGVAKHLPGCTDLAASCQPPGGIPIPTPNRVTDFWKLWRFSPSNENKMSDGGRDRASLGVKMWKSSQNVDAERSAVRSIAWLGSPRAQSRMFSAGHEISGALRRILAVFGHFFKSCRKQKCATALRILWALAR